MKNDKGFLYQAFCDERGKPSSARLIGGLVALVATIAAFFIKPESTAGMFLFASTLLGVSQGKSWSYNKSNKPSTPSKPAPTPSTADVLKK